MRSLLPPVVPGLLVLMLGGCGDDTVTLRGHFLPDSDVTDAYVVGQPLRAVVEADSFVLEGIVGDSFEIAFTEGDDPRGAMRLQGLFPRDLTLRGIWLEDGIAFATTLDGEARATVSGLRMAGAEALPRTLTADGRVLALSGGADALVLRPDDPDLPDLRVVVTPGTAFEWADGEPADEFVSIGDALRVEGTTESGYLVATALILPLPAADPVEEAAEEVEPREPVRGEAVDERRSEERPAPGRGRGRGRGGQRD